MSYDFLSKFKSVHSNRYNYSKVNYKNSKTKVIIICSIHGEFKQAPTNHIRGQGCPKCGNNVRKTLSEFINESNVIHKYKYDYSKTTYVNNKTKVVIICPIHGEFKQIAKSHIQGQGCSKCNGGVQSNTKEFTKKASNIHNNRYNYSKVNYKNSKTKVIIICSIHGTFKQTPDAHLSGQGCPSCFSTVKIDTAQYVKYLKMCYSDQFNYDKVRYVNNKTKIIITCPVHGDFKQRINYKVTCPGCSATKKKRLSDFIINSNIKHNNLYDYSLVEFENTRSKVIIICPAHGEFTQRAYSHLNGQGCPSCNMSKGERKIAKYLNNRNIRYETQYIFDDCYSPNNRALRFDFYLPLYNICIEYDGRQHFESIELWGGDKGLKIRTINDEIKDNYCSENGIKLIRIQYTENNIPNILNRKIG